MLIDYIKACAIFTGKDTPFFGHLHKKAKDYESGQKTYLVNGYNNCPMKISYTPSNGMMYLSGSVMYFWQGHNFTYNKNYFVEAINFIGGLLKVNLWNMIVTEVECGVIFYVNKDTKATIKHHREGKGMTLFEPSSCKDYFRSFNDKFANRKMYDASHNIKVKQPQEMKEILKMFGWNPELGCLKWEVHYKKPEMSLNDGVGIRLCDLTNPKWESRFSQDVFHQYKMIVCMKSLIPPSDKSKFCTQDIFAIELAESKLNEGKTLKDIKKMLYNRINNSPILTQDDKKYRKKQVKAILDKLVESPESIWDISHELETALNPEDDTIEGQF